MNTQDEKFDEMLNVWEQKRERKRKRKNRVRTVIAIVLLVIVWGYSGHLMWQTYDAYTSTEWYEVEAYCIESNTYEEKKWTRKVVNGRRQEIRETETRYNNIYEYAAKDGNVYTVSKRGDTVAKEGTTTTYYVVENNPAQAVWTKGNSFNYVVVLIIAGGMTICILSRLFARWEHPYTRKWKYIS